MPDAFCNNCSNSVAVSYSSSMIMRQSKVCWLSGQIKPYGSLLCLLICSDVGDAIIVVGIGL